MGRYSHLSRNKMEELLEMHFKAMNRRVEVEDQMGECIKVTRPMPDKEKLREWRNRLGNPNSPKLT